MDHPSPSPGTSATRPSSGVASGSPPCGKRMRTSSGPALNYPLVHQVHDALGADVFIHVIRVPPRIPLKKHILSFVALCKYC